MQRCFVIQPFDGGAFDSRYDDVLTPAIVAARLEPYRVARDPSVRIPIENIERGIKSSAICLADITLDNPNVWFELGYAIACSREIVLICSTDRRTKPFDIQHRHIITYKAEAPRDFDRLKHEITPRLMAAQETQTS